MIGQEFIILFKEDKAFITSGKPLRLEQVGLPENIKTFKSPAFWKFRVSNYIEDDSRLFCDIISYHAGYADFSGHQKSFSDRLNEIEKITFRDIDTVCLLQTLDSTSPISIAHPRKSGHFGLGYLKEGIAFSEVKPIERIIRDTFFIPIKDIRFKSGGVSFHQKFKDYNGKIEINIANDYIREEFDAIKNYFANVLNTKKIEVAVTIKIIGGGVASVFARSPEIEKIDEAIIDSVKFELVKSTMRNSEIETDRNLFTLEEYFKTFGEENVNLNTYYSNESELLEDLLKITNTKHYKHLRFLSSKHSHRILKLRFVHKPFSFVFLITGERKYHFVWETLDTEEATYVWHVEKNIETLKVAVRKIEDILSIIKVQGKRAYIGSTDESFRRVYHDYSDLVDGFVKWKGELESVLV